MCGIAGYFGIENKPLLKKMLKTLRHRGPDDSGIFFDKNIGLGNRRLAIIDIKSGKQPIHNEKRDIWIVSNGEIYNFLDLREELTKLGHSFYTKSDTEVIVHAYEEWGMGCLEKLNGMFAFAIWDEKKKRLFLARDRFGIKPLYYFFDKRKFIFASEIKAILQDKSIPAIPNERVIYKFLVYGFNDDEEETFFENIKRLLPAHYMIINKKGIKIKRYWELKITESKNFKNENEIAEDFYTLLKDAIRKHLISEVPIGTCLSGGVDSSVIVCIINKLLKENGNLVKVVGRMQKTFSAVYDDKKIDERKYIEEVVNFTKIKKNYTFPSSKKLWKDLKKIVYFQDEPFLGPSIYAQWEVMKLASKKVKVLLDGQGGDEIFAGYIPYYGIYFRNLLKEKKYFQFLKEFLLSLDLTLPFVFKYFTRKKIENETKKMLNEEFVKKYEKRVRSKWVGDDDLYKFLCLEITKTSLPRLLRYEDRNSSAFSIEARVPFLDHRVVEFVFSLPISMKIKNGWTKYILRKAMKGIIPEKIRWRRSKIGFAVPEKKWLIELKDGIMKVFLSKEFKNRKYFSQEEIVEKFKEFCEGKSSEEYARIFWRILILEFWFRVFCKI